MGYIEQLWMVGLINLGVGPDNYIVDDVLLHSNITIANYTILMELSTQFTIAIHREPLFICFRFLFIRNGRGKGFFIFIIIKISV